MAKEDKIENILTRTLLYMSSIANWIHQDFHMQSLILRFHFLDFERTCLTTKLTTSFTTCFGFTFADNSSPANVIPDPYILRITHWSAGATAADLNAQVRTPRLDWVLGMVVEHVQVVSIVDVERHNGSSWCSVVVVVMYARTPFPPAVS